VIRCALALLHCELEHWAEAGLHYLAALLAEPGREYHALDLVAAVEAPARSHVAASEPAAALRADLGDAGMILDAEAKAQYRRRLDDLRAELEEAERFNTPDARRRGARRSSS